MDNNVEVDLELSRLMTDLKILENKMHRETKEKEIQVETLLEEIKEKHKPYEEQQNILKEKIKDLVLQRAASYKCGAGNITYRKGGVRRSWDLNGLDRTCKENSMIMSGIWHLRNEEPFEPSVLIKINNEGVSNADI